jgi:hypothetical protein
MGLLSGGTEGQAGGVGPKMNMKDEAEFGLAILFCSASPDFGLRGQLFS